MCGISGSGGNLPNKSLLWNWWKKKLSRTDLNFLSFIAIFATQDTLKDIPDVLVTLKGPVLRRSPFDFHVLVFILDETIEKIGGVTIRSDDQIVSSPDLTEIAISSTPKCESVERHDRIS